MSLGDTFFRAVPVPGADCYMVSDSGEVYRSEFDHDTNGEIIRLLGAKLKLRKNDEGYLKVKLICDDGKRRDFFVHRLVLLAFSSGEYLAAPEPNKLQACHKDRSDRTNCALDNLYWGTHAQNHADKVRAGTHRNGCVRKLTRRQAAAIRRSKKPVKVLAGKYNVSISHVRNIRNNKRLPSFEVGMAIREWKGE